MTGEWKEVKLGDVASVIAGQSPKGENYNKNGCGLPFYQGKKNYGERYLNPPTVWTTEVTKRAKKDDILMSVRAPVGALNIATEEICIGRGLAAIRAEDGVDRVFLFFQLLSVADNLDGSAGTIFNSINKKQLENVVLLLPPLSEQRAIAHILGTLDDKIEVNRRMNETLEEMARSLFKSWFVDFDPVHAKVALNHRAPSHHSPLEGESARQGPWPAAAPVGGLRRLYSPRTLQRAKALRQNRTDAEGLLWHFLRNRQLDGYKFRRQQPIGPYIADFACLSEKLLIELDGGHHAERSSHDAARDRYLQDRGYKVLRFWNNDVFGNCLGVLERIQAALTVVPPPHQPSPDGSASATPPQGGSDGSKWSVERARAYLNRMDPKIANLFPDALDDEGKPVGWVDIALKQLGKVVTGKTPNTKRLEYFGNQMPFLKIPDMHGKLYVLTTSSALSEEGAKSQVKKTLPVGSISVSCIATPGLVVLNHRETQTNQQINSLIPTDPEQSHFAFWSCKHLAADIMVGGSAGSIFHNMNKTSFENLELVFPGSKLARLFSKTVSSLHNRILANEYESLTLAQTRDTLLPKLISGDIRVAEAEKAVETVT